MGVEAQMDQVDKLIQQTLYSVNPRTGLPYSQGTVQTANGTGGRTFTMVPPTGTITLFGGATAPSGWLKCDGATPLIASYPALFAVIGSIYGTATATTFTLPGAAQLPLIPGVTPLGIYIIKV